MPARTASPKRISWGWIVLTAALVCWAFVLGLLVGQGVFAPQEYLNKARAWFSPPKVASVKEDAKSDKLTKPELSFYKGLLNKPAERPAPRPQPRPAAARPAPPPAPIPAPAPIADRAAAPSETEPGPRYTVQVASFVEHGKAKELADSLAQDGHPAYIVKATLKNAGSRFRVRVGNYTAKAEADALARRFRKQSGRAAFVVKK